MTLYLNPKMVEWFNEWQSTPDLLGMVDEKQYRLLDISHAFSIIWSRLDDEERSNELRSWLFFFISMYEEEWSDYLAWKNSLYREWLKRKMDGEAPSYGINQDMIMAMVENYQSNFTEEFQVQGHLWWDWNFIESGGDRVPTYPLLFGNETQRKFESILNWINENPLEVEQ